MNIVNYKGIVNIDKDGVVLKNGQDNIYINFDECIKNYIKETKNKSSKCVALRDSTKLMFIFYTNPKTIINFKKQRIKNLLFGKSDIRDFIAFQKAINNSGYTTFDLT